MKVQIKNDERWFFCGTTGYGKSFLARELLKKMYRKNYRIVIIDGPDHGFAKKNSRFGNGTIDKPRKTVRYLRDKHVRVQMFQPDVEAWSDPNFTRFLRDIMKDSNVVVYFDELVGLVDQNHSPIDMQRLWVQGRKKNICAWASCQRPSLIPTYVMAQSNNWCIFRLQNPIDRQRVSQYTGTLDIKNEFLEKHYFWYYNLDMKQAQLMKPVA